MARKGPRRLARKGPRLVARCARPRVKCLRPPAPHPFILDAVNAAVAEEKKRHRCNKILTGRKGKDGRMRREGGAQGREGVRRGKGEGVGEGGTGLSDWFKCICQASAHPARLMGAVCSRRTRGPLAAPHAVLLNNALIQVRARLLLSVAERSRGPPIPQGLRDWRHAPLE